VPEESDAAILAEAFDESAKMVGAARQPVIIAGEELSRFEVADILPGLLERTGIPCATTMLSKSVINEGHPLYMGVYAGALGLEPVRAYVESSDCVIVLGANLSDVTLGVHTAKIEPSKMIHVTSDRISVRRALYEHIVFKDLILKIEPFLGTRPAPASIPHPPRPAPWVANADAPITMSRLVQCLNQRLTPQTVVVAEAGDCCFATMDLFVEQSGYVACAYYLSLGFGVPAALGAQVARPTLRPLVLVGDGAFQMTGMELTSIIRANRALDPIVIVVNNQGYGTERPMIDGSFNDVNDWRYAELPRVLGSGKGWDVATEGELERALDEAEANRGAISILDVRIPIGDISESLRRLTTALGQKARGEG
jgi:indolepyruvate decarboxylase